MKYHVRLSKKTANGLRSLLGSAFLLTILSLFIFVVLLIFLFSRVVININAGEGGIIFRPFSGGTVTEQIYTEGIHFISPINTMTIYDLRMQLVTHKFAVLTNRGLPVDLNIAVRYRPDYDHLGLLHKKIGPDYPNKIIIPQIESVLRKGLGNSTPEDIYMNKDELLNKLITESIKEISYNYVFVEDVIIRSVTLPEEIKKSIENKITQEQKYLAYSFILKAEEQEAERKRIESEGIKVFSENIAKAVTRDVLDWNGIQATLKLAESQNSKIIVIGSGQNGLPLILNSDDNLKKETATTTSKEVEQKTEGAK